MFFTLLAALFLVVSLAAARQWTTGFVSWQRSLGAFVLGVAVLPSGWFLSGGPDGRFGSDGRVAFQVLLFSCVGITLALAALIARLGSSPVRYFPVALCGLLGMLTIPLALFITLAIACSGSEDCI